MSRLLCLTDERTWLRISVSGRTRTGDNSPHGNALPLSYTHCLGLAGTCSALSD